MVAGDIMRTHLPIVYPVDHAKRLCMLLTKFEDQEFFPVVQDEGAFLIGRVPAWVWVRTDGVVQTHWHLLALRFGMR